MTARSRVVVYSHSMLFYWWPVWAAGFIMAGLCFVDDQRLAVVPAGTVAKDDVLTPPKGKHLPVDPVSNEVAQPHLHTTSSKSAGVLFMTILLVVIFSTNIPLRGLWSVIFIGTAVFLAIIFALLRINEQTVWDHIIHYVSFLDIRINMGGYLFLSVGLFIIWFVVTFVFDRQICMVFTPGTVTVQQAIGDGAKVYMTGGMVVTRRRDDLFRHVILGFGSGDIVIAPAGAHEIDMPNVLFSGRRLREIEAIIKVIVAVPS